jgi:hypothetical protein
MSQEMEGRQQRGDAAAAKEGVSDRDRSSTKATQPSTQDSSTESEWDAMWKLPFVYPEGST